ncbi:hypothetical protein TCAL_15548, partial [Tigriopus californicus]
MPCPSPVENQENETPNCRRAKLVREHEIKLEQIPGVINSDIYNDEAKDSLIQQLQTLPLSMVE